MNFDRGFIKWQPFNSVVPSNVLIKNSLTKSITTKPCLFPEEIEKLSSQIQEAYYTQEKIKIEYYENGKIKSMESYIRKLCPNSHTLYLGNSKIIYFNQIIKIKS